MQLFQLQASLQGQSQMASFLKDNFVAIGFSSFGDLEQLSEEEIAYLIDNHSQERTNTSQHKAKPQLQHTPIDSLARRQQAQSIITFVQEMKDGDWVLVKDNGWVYLGDVGDYFYDHTPESIKDDFSQKRGVTWLTRIPFRQLNGIVQKFLQSPLLVSRFEDRLSSAELDRWMLQPSSSAQDQAGQKESAEPCPKLDEVQQAYAKLLQGASREQQPLQQLSSEPPAIKQETILQAIAILEQAMHGEDAIRREQAAAALLGYAGHTHRK